MEYARTFEWRITAAAEGMKIKDYLQESQTFSSRTYRAVKKEGQMLVNGVSKKGYDVLSENDSLQVSLPEEVTGSHIVPMSFALSVLYEDEDVIVIDKPPGVPSLPPQSGDPLNIASALLAHYQTNGERTAIHLVNRLDRDTSGAMMAAKHKHAHHILSQQQQDKTMRRAYTAILEGCIQPEAGTIDQPIGMSPGSKVARAVIEDGKKAVTHYTTERIGRVNKKSQVHVTLETGRTHQIRVHMAWLGYPVMGDTLYGAESAHIGRQALHCRQMMFSHPLDGRSIEIDCPLHEDMDLLI
ncbi:RluA family pseudouridine synthase [Aureibacillus halotolerans]|uniref:Pseudouridine synthase n=1 Tax=Aureibacillus halotolerans TaxID=1508390 RepID=A0A4R6UG80_9BACI|nr:RluA family pseudouridine synthase [Aureibacillus halotolerans]TDQ42144.1 23S rRNA pseudouridine1911/1915/1917 synthase [Aureibacillus halotolerans]